MRRSTMDHLIQIILYIDLFLLASVFDRAASLVSAMVIAYIMYDVMMHLSAKTRWTEILSKRLETHNARPVWREPQVTLDLYVYMWKKEQTWGGKASAVLEMIYLPFLAPPMMLHYEILRWHMLRKQRAET